MTGYGQGKAANQYGRFIVEVQTINRKHLEVNVNLPKDLIQIENDLRKEVSDKISRGKINVYVGFDRAGSKSRAVTIDYDLAKKYHDAYAKLKSKFRVRGDIDLGALISAKNVVNYEEVLVNPSAIMKDVKKALSEALVRLEKMRRTEGGAIHRDLKARLKAIKDDARIIERIMPKTVKEFELKVKARVKEFEGERDGDERIAREVALFADRIDVSEEILRLESHIAQFLQTLEKSEPVGKVMDFIIQEMLREANTIGSKANSVEISRRVINIKSELEKIREQIQNVE
jgi:uncharacterized protein (TIGR00255 family)